MRLAARSLWAARRYASSMHPETLLASATCNPQEDSGAVSPAIYMSTTFARDAAGEYHPEGEHIYGRLSNPNRSRLEQLLATLDNGSRSFAFSSGMQAASALLQTLQPGAKVLLTDDIYFGVKELVDQVYSRWGVTYTQIDQADTAAVKSLIETGDYQMLWLESPSNPLLKLADIQQLSACAKEHTVTTVVDSTWAPPLITQPLELGADAVLHSTTKFIAGHSDVTGGAVTVADSFHQAQQLETIQTIGGGVPSPFDCWLTARGLRTMSVRLERQTRNAEVIASYLENHPKIEYVYYPGLASHPQHELASQQMASYGSMMSFGVLGGEEQAWAMKRQLQLIIRATSLGATETLIEHRRSVETVPVSPPNLLRLSVGIEHVDDLLQDLEQALQHV